MEVNRIIQGDALEKLKELPEESINCCMTSPPYWALRDYGVEGQLGLESTFQDYINKLCDIFDEVKRVLREDGTCWVNIGDTYANSGKGAGGDIKGSKQVWSFNEKEKRICNNCGKEFIGWKFQNFCGSACSGVDNTKRIEKGLLESKSLCNIPARFSIEMQNRGWILRNVIIWHKPNCMPCSVKDRFTVDFEYLFFFVKNKKYWFETQRENLGSICTRKRSSAFRIQKENDKELTLTTNGRNKRAVWKITTKPFKESHFATYPEALCETPIKAGCPEFVCNKCGKARKKIFESDWKNKRDGTWKEAEVIGKEMQRTNTHRQSMAGGLLQIKEPSKIEFKGYTNCDCNAGFSGGIVLDPFFGAGTTGLVALKQNKNFIGVELNPEYIKIAETRIKPYLEQKTLTT